MPPGVLALGAIPAVIGLVFVVIGRVQRNQVRRWHTTTGVVVPAPPDGGVAAWRFSWFAFRDHRGLEFVVADRGGSSPFVPLHGRSVPVLYDPDAPTRARVGTPGGLGVVYLGVGWGLLALALIVEIALVSVYLSLR